MDRDIEFTQQIRVHTEFGAPGEGIAVPPQDDATLRFGAGPNIGGEQAMLDVSIDFGVAGDGVTVQLDVPALSRFARTIMHLGIQVHEIVWDLSAREKVTVTERLDDVTVLVTGPGGQYRLHIGDIARPRTIADPEPRPGTNGDGPEAPRED